MRLLLAEDEKDLSKALVEILKRSHYSVDPVYDGQDALDYALLGNYDGIILDIMMPKKDGLTVLRELRAAKIETPVLILTARSEIDDKILGLDLGADDYLAKPFNMGELLARVRAIVRRGVGKSENLLRCGNVSLDPTTYRLSCGDQELKLSGKEYQMMELLIRQPGRVISTQNFMERIWGYDAEAEINVVWVYISALRKKLAQIGASVQIKATRGVGYSLEEEK
ncbi:MAG: response regulator transcription factor [Clostridia bacterium]|nr:response regulator transcription factor [Clostridia bacterium]